jgi:hypothetical protein
MLVIGDYKELATYYYLNVSLAYLHTIIKIEQRHHVALLLLVVVVFSLRLSYFFFLPLP